MVRARRATVEIEPYRGVGARAEDDRRINEIFFSASSVQSFRDEAHRAAFQWLWLGRYLAEEPQHAFLARSDGQVCGYLVGSINDPASRDEFETLAYFREFAVETRCYPAHLHVNVAAGMRSQGVGALLVSVFSTHASEQGAAGLHIVTGVGMRNVGFYQRQGFREVARTEKNGSDVVMLAKALHQPRRQVPDP